MSYDRSPFSLTPWVRRLLVATAAVFLLQKTVFYGGGLEQSLAFVPGDVLRRPWSVLTYALLHLNFLHFLVNMLVLFMFGPPVENRIGSRSFLYLYAISAMGGAMLSLLMMPLMGRDAVVIGASAATYGIMMGFVLEWPDAPVMIFPLPVPVKAKWLVIFLASLSLVSGLFQLGSHVAHFAHLGGFAAAFLYLRGGQMLTRQPPARPAERSPAVLVRPSGSDVVQADFTPPQAPRRTPDATVKAEVDRVLDKISQRGLNSLTSEERRFLDEMSKRFKQDH